MKKLFTGMMLVTALLAGCAHNTPTEAPNGGHEESNSMSVQNPSLPSWLSISSDKISSITIQGWGPGAAGNFTIYPANGTSPRLINTLIDGLSNAKAIKPYTTPISQGGGEWIELTMTNGTSISFATFPNEPKPIQYIVNFDDKSQGPKRSTMISDVSGKVTTVLHEIAKGKLVRQKSN